MNEPPMLPNRRVLVIDDNPSVIADFRKILCAQVDGSAALAAAETALFGDAVVAARPDFEVDSATQGQEGFALVEAAQRAGRPYAVVFVDMRMPPGWDGVETIARIWDKDPRLQVVICTAFSDHSWDEMSARLHLDDRLLILKKPFDDIEAYQLACALAAKWEMTRRAELKIGTLEHEVSLRMRALERANDALEAEIAERRTLERDLERLSITDPLTGVANRRRFDNALTTEWRRALRVHRPVGVAMIDVDNFKGYNDRYGHISGDKCLQSIAAALSQSVRQNVDLVARYGGEEFVVILPGADRATTGEIAERARAMVAALDQPHAGVPGGIVTISIGIATAMPSQGGSAEGLVANADAALYEAKRCGRNRVLGAEAP
jgi:diguanylate cyclase (GGDEF)-like protein